MVKVLSTFTLVGGWEEGGGLVVNRDALFSRIISQGTTHILLPYEYIHFRKRFIDPMIKMHLLLAEC